MYMPLLMHSSHQAGQQLKKYRSSQHKNSTQHSKGDKDGRLRSSPKQEARLLFYQSLSAQHLHFLTSFVKTKLRLQC
jgi:hypothetical protein